MTAAAYQDDKQTPGEGVKHHRVALAGLYVYPVPHSSSVTGSGLGSHKAPSLSPQVGQIELTPDKPSVLDDKPRVQHARSAAGMSP